jgi:hypothetical protein
MHYIHLDLSVGAMVGCLSGGYRCRGRGWSLILGNRIRAAKYDHPGPREGQGNDLLEQGPIHLHISPLSEVLLTIQIV